MGVLYQLVPWISLVILGVLVIAIFFIKGAMLSLAFIILAHCTTGSHDAYYFNRILVIL